MIIYENHNYQIKSKLTGDILESGEIDIKKTDYGYFINFGGRGHFAWYKNNTIFTPNGYFNPNGLAQMNIVAKFYKEK